VDTHFIRKGFVKRAFRKHEAFTDEEGEWLSQRRAMPYVDTDAKTLWLWSQGRGGRCPYLGGEALRTKFPPPCLGRQGPYYLKSQLDRVRAAKAALRPRRDCPDLLSFCQAARFVGLATDELRELARNGELTVVRQSYRRIRQGGIRQGEFLHRKELAALRKRLNNPDPPRPDPRLISHEDALQLDGCTEWMLRRMVETNRLKVERVPIPRAGKRGPRPAARYYLRKRLMAELAKRGTLRAISPEKMPLSEAAKALGLSKLTVWRWRRHGCCHLGGRRISFDPPTTWRPGLVLRAEIEEIQRRRSAVLPAPSAASDNGRRSDDEARLARESKLGEFEGHPVRVTNDVLRVCIVGNQRRTSAGNAGAPADCILSLGNSCYDIGGQQRTVTDREDRVLSAFVRQGAMTNKQLGKASNMEKEEAARVLRALRTRYDGIFAPAITPAGARDRGGHRVNICVAASPE
jgi:hypothetical protein